ncbi:DctP family TRAP transporter solute-binding subunit [Spiractinospora alimapuensis]|uniref:DctP family TRAP transporter solute-binding subunit n=1 Tax=Spiractinospora alimapuensis TaxID=2820884 RepID=UPI001F3347C8|nr:DctP family TRAP transporter solute-binding subunit [Spiractinospora alimapuensis]QVQ50820.1 DctP family TRAP transporter solute-binding subunit [Spiractinospora alimapuensis]
MGHTRTGLTVTATALALLATGCVGHAPDVDPDDLRPAGDADAEVTLRLSHAYDVAHPAHTCGAEPLRDRLADVGVDLQIFPSAQLGTEEQALQLLHTGNLEMTVAGPAFLGTWYSPAEVFDAAYAFEDVDHFDAVTNGPIGDEVWAELNEETGLRVLGSWYYGSRHTSANQPVQQPGDLTGQKVRVPTAPVYLSNMEIMGGTATPMALGEVYLGLQQGVIDAQENPIPTMRTMRFDEVQTHISLTAHIVQGVMPVIADAVYEDLSPDLQAELDDATMDAAQQVRVCIEEQEEEMLEEWRENADAEIVDDVDTEAFAEAARERLPEMHPEWGEIYTRIQDAARE